MIRVESESHSRHTDVTERRSGATSPLVAPTLPVWQFAHFRFAATGNEVTKRQTKPSEKNKPDNQILINKSCGYNVAFSRAVIL